MAKGKLEQGIDKFTGFMQEAGFPMEKRELFLQALTHPTFFEGAKQAIPQDNQRLEFLGDAILDLVVGDYLYHAYPAAHEGELSKMRAALVCESALALQAKDFGLGKLLRLGKGGESSGDRYRPSVLADAFEALIGAIYEANGFMAAHSFIITHFAAAIAKLTKDDYEDRKSLLQELVQSETMYGVSYKTLRQDGPDHAPRFESGAYCKEILLGRGWGNSKKESEQAAAAAALASKSKWLPTMGYRR